MKLLYHYVIPVFFLTVLAYLFQTTLLLHGDVAYLLHAANQMLAGEKYGQDIFETNPPMILYIYSPVCLFAKLTSINIITAVRVYTILIALTSLSLCYVFIKRIIAPQDNILVPILFYTLLIVFLFLPVNQFGQRDHLFLMLTMPYYFAAILRLEKHAITIITACLIGVLAGFGFAIKPYFLAPLVLIEMYFILSKRHFFGWIRIETIIILTILLLYLYAIFLHQPHYITVVLPIVSHFYFTGSKIPLAIIFVIPLVIFCLVVLFSYFVFYKDDHYSTLSKVLTLALAGTILAFIIPQTPRYYNVLPAVSIACLILSYRLGMIASICLQSRSNPFVSYLLLLLLSLILFLIPLFQAYYLLQEAKERNKHCQELISFAKHKNDASIFCFALNTWSCFPLVYQANKTYSSRFPFFWWIIGMIKQEGGYPQTQKLSSSLQKDKDFLIESMANDLERYQTQMVVLNQKEIKYYINDSIDNTFKFNVITYFSQNKKFRDEWKHYHYLTTIGHYEIYERST